MSVKKQYVKKKPVCKVTFELHSVVANKVNIVGDFNNWNTNATSMKKSERGGFTVTINLEKGREYEFLYLIDKCIWEVEREADRFTKSPYGYCDNSVVVI